ncbi:MAG: hypothetical protein KME32_30715 [Mojavia pulchra JT2-VF2]|uniref:Uncharacterized protein n=1 Tax=Mojavia pulchra JT2-VF2 TaxID=287848 RepID=A0A951Q717_9NOST|nr:hypothetical protein [Mojavia pulchra JT2-VF2]
MNRILKQAIVLLLAVSLLFTILVTTNKPAYACRCLEFPSPQVALNNATAVFTGRVISAAAGRATFSISQIWKGEVLQKHRAYFNFGDHLIREIQEIKCNGRRCATFG